MIVAELTPKFPDFRVALVVAEGLAIAPHRSATLDSEIAEAGARCGGISRIVVADRQAPVREF
ncbi:MAG: hypothetical protein WAL59_26025 [Roseiarcus sp.]